MPDREIEAAHEGMNRRALVTKLAVGAFAVPAVVAFKLDSLARAGGFSKHKDPGPDCTLPNGSQPNGSQPDGSLPDGNDGDDHHHGGDKPPKPPKHEPPKPPKPPKSDKPDKDDKHDKDDKKKKPKGH